jgi:hypothetical protein
VNFEAAFADLASCLTVDGRDSDAPWAGEDMGSAIRVEGVDGEDFWKNPRIDFWFFIFCVLDVDFLSGVAAGGEEAGCPLAISNNALYRVLSADRFRTASFQVKGQSIARC